MYPYTVIINQTTQRLRLTNNLRLCLISVSKKAENLYIDRIHQIDILLNIAKHIFIWIFEQLLNHFNLLTVI